MMPDREKVINVLECCKRKDGNECKVCPYTESEYCTEDMVTDALALLKEQEELIDNLKQEIRDKNERLKERAQQVDTLLKEQEAVEPIPFYTETVAESPNYVICGHCKSIKAIMSKNTKQKYCHECGFPVLWEGR